MIGNKLLKRFFLLGRKYRCISQEEHMQWKVSRNHNRTEVKYFKYDTQYGPDTGIEYLAVREPDGTFSVATFDGDFKKVPYVGEYDNYREMDSMAQHLTKPFVCRVAHNDDDAYVLFTNTGDYYIRVE